MTEQSTQNQAQDTREYSVSELDQAVANGQITQPQRDQIFAQQIERKAMRQATEAAAKVVETQTRENTLDGELQQYASVSRELMQDGSPLRERVAQEFEYLVQRGASRDLTTELAAVRAVMGPIERAKQFASARARGADPSMDSYGGRPLTPRERRAEDQWGRLDPRQREFYAKHIQSGMYADKAEVLAELNWKRGGSNNRRGAA